MKVEVKHLSLTLVEDLVVELTKSTNLKMLK